MSGLSLRVMNMKFMQKSSLNSNKLSDLEISREQAAKASDSSEWTSKSNANIVKSIKSLRQNTKVTSIGYASIQNFGSGDCTEALVRGRRSFVPKEQQQSSSTTNSQQEDKVKLDLNNLRESLDDEKVCYCNS